MSKSPVKFRPDTGTGHYLVEDRATGAALGRVVKSSRYYNIAPRGLWVHSWRAYPEGTREAIGGVRDPRNYSTRTDAAAALLAAARLPQEGTP